jgi:hypothetical protein
MSTGKTFATGLEIAPANFRPWPITATKIATGIRKMIPPMIVVLIGFSMIKRSLLRRRGASGTGRWHGCGCGGTLLTRGSGLHERRLPATKLS